MNWKKLDFFLLVLPVLLTVLGIVTLSSTFSELAESQIIFFLVGAFLYFLVLKTDYRAWGHFSRYLFIVSMALLIFVFIAGHTIFGSTRWLQIGGFSLQPSEIMKVSLALFLSWSISQDKGIFKSFLRAGKLIFVSFFAIALVFIQPDLGTSIVLMAIALGVLWVGGLNKVYFFIAAAFLGVFSAPAWNILKSYQKERILVFLNPALDTLGIGYNVIQSMIAIGSGQLFGKGFGYGTQSHLQFLPVYWTDFIFAAFAEEWGFVGVLLLVILYVALLVAIIRVAVTAKDTFGMLLAFSVFFIFFCQFTVNVGMNLGILPVTGIPLPLISYGGSSFLVSMMLLGLVQSVWINNKN